MLPFIEPEAAGPVRHTEVPQALVKVVDPDLQVGEEAQHAVQSQRRGDVVGDNFEAVVTNLPHGIVVVEVRLHLGKTGVFPAESRGGWFRAAGLVGTNLASGSTKLCRRR